MNLKKRITLIAAIPLTFLTIVSGYAFYTIGFLANDVEIFSKQRMPIQAHVGDARFHFAVIMKLILKLQTLDPSSGDFQRQSSELKALIQSEFEIVKKDYEFLSKLLTTEKNQALIQKAKAADHELEQAVMELFEKATARTEEGFQKIEALYGMQLTLLKELDQNVNDLNQQLTEEANIASNRAEILIEILASLALITSISISILIGKKLVRELTELTKTLRSLSESVNSQSGDLGHASSELAASITESASAIEETSASLEEINSQLKLTSNSTHEAAQIGKSTINSIQNMTQSLQALNLKVTSIAENAKQVCDIINIIDDIAFQTNLLALNASVEAARAGEHGKGFTVVADAVRTLAHKTTESSKQIIEIVGKSTTLTAEGQKLSLEVFGITQETAKAAERLVALVSDIQVAVSEQNIGVNQITTAVSLMSTAAQSNSASTEQTAASSQQLSEASDTLRTNSMKLELIVGVA